MLQLSAYVCSCGPCGKRKRRGSDAHVHTHTHALVHTCPLAVEAHMTVKWAPRGMCRHTQLKQYTHTCDMHIMAAPHRCTDVLLRQRDVLSHFTGGVKWNIFYHINKQGCHNFLWFWPPKVNFWATLASSRHAFLSHSDKHCHSLYKEHKDVSHSQVGNFRLSPCELTNRLYLRVKQRWAGFPQAGLSVCSSSKTKVKVRETD